MYSGNYGLGHDFGTLLSAVERLTRSEDVVFVFIGEGKQYESVKTHAVGHRVVFLPFQPEEKISSSLSAGSVHVVTLKPGLEGLLVPGKVYGAMAAGRPIIFVGPTHSEVADIIRRAECGYEIEPGDTGALVAAIKALKDDAALQARMGRNARALLDREYARSIATARLRQILEGVPRQAPWSRWNA
jgi:glycosyltransferase involved in cell wall biosynthesis